MPTIDRNGDTVFTRSEEAAMVSFLKKNLKVETYLDRLYSDSPLEVTVILKLGDTEFARSTATE